MLFNCVLLIILFDNWYLPWFYYLKQTTVINLTIMPVNTYFILVFVFF